MNLDEAWEGPLIEDHGVVGTLQSVALVSRYEDVHQNFRCPDREPNHAGLYAEQLGHRGEYLGKFPQAFTHLGLIKTAIELDLRLSKRGGVY